MPSRMEETPKIHFPMLQIDAIEARVLGSLLEKEATTPAYYPLTLNSLQAACNQSSNRNPVTSLELDTIEKALKGLRAKGLALKVQAAGARVEKYRHILPQVLDLDDAQRAVLTVLLLRGPQTAGEIKQRAERMHEFESLADVEQCLRWFEEYPHGALVLRRPAGGGRRVETFQHLLGGCAGIEAPARDLEVIALEEESLWRVRLEQKVDSLEATVEELSAMLRQLRQELGAE